MASPEYLICLECETPCYEFDWDDGEVKQAQCLLCGNEETDQFVLPEDFDELTS